MTKDEAIKRLKEWQGCSDKEIAHTGADHTLCEFLVAIGHGDVVKEYDKIDKWYA